MTSSPFSRENPNIPYFIRFDDKDAVGENRDLLTDVVNLIFLKNSVKIGYTNTLIFLPKNMSGSEICQYINLQRALNPIILT